MSLAARNFVESARQRRKARIMQVDRARAPCGEEGTVGVCSLSHGVARVARDRAGARERAATVRGASAMGASSISFYRLAPRESTRLLRRRTHATRRRRLLKRRRRRRRRRESVMPGIPNVKARTNALVNGPENDTLYRLMGN